MFSQITANVLATPQGTVTKPSVNLHFHRCHLDRTGYLSVPSGFVSTWLLFLSSPKLRASAHTVNRRELSYAVRALTCSLRIEKSITKAALLQPDSISPPSRQLPAMKSSRETMVIELHIRSPWCLQKAEDMVAIMWAVGHQGRLGKGNFFTSTSERPSLQT